MKKSQIIGTFYSSVGAATYGTNPLFALILYANGITVNSVLFYRYLIAVIIFGLWLKFYKKVSLAINKTEILSLFVLGLLFSFSSITLFSSYNYIDIGVASTILFIYPVIVAILMGVFFKERISFQIFIAIVLTTVGTLLLYKGKYREPLNLHGVILVLTSALMYALYMVGVKKIPVIKKMHFEKLSFYVIFFGLFVYIYNLKFCTQLQALTTPQLWVCVVALAILPTIISLETTTIGIKLIGSTKTAILGALEPVTALLIGVLIFHEQLTFRIILGIIAIISAATLVVLSKRQ